MDVLNSTMLLFPPMEKKKKKKKKWKSEGRVLKLLFYLVGNRVILKSYILFWKIKWSWHLIVSSIPFKYLLLSLVSSMVLVDIVIY